MDNQKVRANVIVKAKAAHDTSLNIHIWKKVDIRKVKVDHLTLLACLPYTLSLVSNLEVKVPKICAEHLVMYILQNAFKINWKNVWNLAETVPSVGTGKQFYILLRLAIAPYYP